jgi:bacillithiol biosynthesis cysteine-adding enzyme BshC
LNAFLHMAFQKETIPYSESKLLPQIVLDYLDGKLSWLTGYEKNSAFETVIQRKLQNKTSDRTLLVDILKGQNSAFSLVQEQNLELLLNENTFTVTTGHQLNLFTGPLYFIYKIITTINLSEELASKYKDYKFVPIYWMASEDHDIIEINHLNVFGKKLEWKTEQNGASGGLNCNGVYKIIEEVEMLLGNSPYSKHIIDLMRVSYSEENSLATATRIFVNELFKEYGLLILDADNALFKKRFSAVMFDDLKNHSAYNLINKTIDQLQEKNYEIQVHPREVNLFLLKNNSRERIIEENNEYSTGSKDLINTQFIWDQNHASSLSPNVVLRPLYQELILPNIAYIGGPAEIAYWLELKSTFDFYKIDYPVLVLRNFAIIVDENSFYKMKKMNLSIKDFLNPSDVISKQYLLRNNDAFSTESEIKKIEEIYEELKEKIFHVDSTLIATVEAEKKKNLKSLKAVEEKVLRAGKKKEEISIIHIKKIKEKLFPGGIPHERIDSFLPYYAKYGKSFLSSIKENFKGEDNVVVLLEQ